MFSQHQELSNRQANCFISFLIDGTDKAIIALEEVFGLYVDSSDSDIELAPINKSRFLQHLGKDTVYTIHSEMSGDIEGGVTLMLRSTDFRYLGDAMRPVLSLMFLASPDSDLESLEQDKPEWLQSETCPGPNDESFHVKMMDLLSELGNVLIGRYAKSLHQVFHLTMHHTIPVVEQVTVAEIRPDSETQSHGEAMQIVIENEFLVDGHPIKIWCLISPSERSFPRFLGATRH